MKALVYHGPGQRGWDTIDDSIILDSTDAIVRIDTSTICGTDLHVLKGNVPETTPGTVLDHEAVGTVQEVGASVGTVASGDCVLMSCVSVSPLTHIARGKYGYPGFPDGCRLPGEIPHRPMGGLPCMA